MKQFNLDTLNEQSFTDYNVILMDVDFDRKNILINIDGATLVENNIIKYINQVNISIRNWHALSINFEDQLIDANKFNHILTSLKLSSICEFIYNDSCLILKGYTGEEDGGWVEWKIIGAEVAINGL